MINVCLTLNTNIYLNERMHADLFYIFNRVTGICND